MTVHTVCWNGRKKVSVTGTDSIIRAYMNGKLLGNIQFIVDVLEAEKGWVRVHFQEIWKVL